jgi:hypothetical protein
MYAESHEEPTAENGDFSLLPFSNPTYAGNIKLITNEHDTQVHEPIKFKTHD